MVTETIDILEELSSTSQVHHLKRDDIDKIMFDFAKRLTLVLRIERINVWLFNKDKSAIISIGEYDLRTQSFFKETAILKKSCPNYFELLSSNKFIYIEDSNSDTRVNEIRESYLIPNEVVSMVDVPLRMGGEMFGVMCFEKTGQTARKFTENNLSFMYSVATVLASNLEARYRRAIQEKLSKALSEKEILIKEINHRVKNNFSIIISLLRISKNGASINELKVFCDEYEQRIFSMLKIHNLLYQSEQYTEVNLSQYLNELVNEFNASYYDLNVQFETKIDHIPYNSPTKQALHIGLSVTEIFLNAIKHGKKEKNDFKFHLHFVLQNGKTILKVGDNGEGFSFDQNLGNGTLGLALIKNLLEEINSSVTFPEVGNSSYQMTFD